MTLFVLCHTGRSYCRHIAKVKSSVAHLVKTEVSFKPKEIPVTNDVGPELESSGLGDELWEEFLEKRDVSKEKRVSITALFIATLDVNMA